MNGDANLVQMANRIGDFFAAMPDHGEALEGIVTHLRKFWEPRMRRRIYALLDAADADSGHDARLQPLVVEALRAARTRLEPQPARARS